MAGSMNRATLIGHLGKDPEVRRLTSGDPVVNLSVATSESWKDKSTGEKKEKTEWHRVVIFNKNLAEIAEKYLHKGDKVMIEGKIQTRKWSGSDGVEKYTTEIILSGFDGQILMLSTKGAGGDRGADDQGTRQAQRPAAQPPAAFNRDELDDEIPF